MASLGKPPKLTPRELRACSPREKALYQRQMRCFGIKAGQLFWERNGINDRSCKKNGSILLILREFSVIYTDSGFQEKTFLALVTEADGRVYVRQGHRFLTEFDEGCTDRLSF